jgi:hypothetical protein
MSDSLGELQNDIEVFGRSLAGQITKAARDSRCPVCLTYLSTVNQQPTTNLNQPPPTAPHPRATKKAPNYNNQQPKTQHAMEMACEL